MLFSIVELFLIVICYAKESIRCFYSNETILIYGRNASAELRLWPLKMNQNAICASLNKGATLLINSLYYSTSVSISNVSMKMPVKIPFTCPDIDNCESFVRNANSVSYKLTANAFAGQAVIRGSIKSLLRHNFVYQECWSSAQLLYSISSTRDLSGICIAANPTPCRAPPESLSEVTAEIRLTVNGSSYILPISPNSKVNVSGNFALPFKHMQTNYYCYICSESSPANELTLCREVATQIQGNIDFDATLVVNIPYTNKETGIVAPLRYSMHIFTKGSLYYANCFQISASQILWNRVFVALKQNIVAANCADPLKTNTIYFTLILKINKRSGVTSRLQFKHKVGNFNWTDNRYWFLCKTNQTCLSEIHEAYTNSYETFGYLLIEFLAENQSVVDDLTIWVTPTYSCFRTVDIFITRSELRVSVKTLPQYCASEYNAFANSTAYSLTVYKNSLDDLEYMSPSSLGRFEREIENWNPNTDIVFTCDLYDTSYNDDLCRNVFKTIYKLARAGKIIATLYLSNYSIAIGRIYCEDYLPIYVSACAFIASLTIAGSVYVVLTIRQHRKIVKSL